MLKLNITDRSEYNGIQNGSRTHGIALQRLF